MCGDFRLTSEGVMAEPVHMSRLTDPEGQKQQTVRRASTGAERPLRAMMLLASADVPFGPRRSQPVRPTEILSET
jgi:hypothetical protein